MGPGDVSIPVNGTSPKLSVVSPSQRIGPTSPKDVDIYIHWRKQRQIGERAVAPRGPSGRPNAAASIWALVISPPLGLFERLIYGHVYGRRLLVGANPYVK